MNHIYIDISPCNDLSQLTSERAKLVKKLSDMTEFESVPITAVNGKKEFLAAGYGSLGFDEMPAGSVYLDMSTDAVPQRNFLYPVLRAKGVQIVSFVCKAMTNIISEPWNTDEASLMKTLDYLSAVMKYSCGAVYENSDAQKALDELCSKEESANINAVEPSKISSLSKETGTVIDVAIKQMAVLTARNEDIMKSLPYIEEYMTFIKELVVCCPERNVQPFKECYKGRLSLKFITDDQLLGGRKLPSDHQARNFFLRCRLMKRDELDDVFIMTDDDYRPLKPLTEEVFIKDGRYQAYYFYDITKWQGTYNNYTSFDEGAFKTRDFLIENGYDTLQYSSHQPQLIDKRIFREMTKVHANIENNPFDEWSTYFNFGLYHYPDKFKPCRNVSMCWPAELASWELYHEPGEFLFENFYKELYEQDCIFCGFSQEFSPDTQRENAEKIRICRALVEKHMHQQSVYKNYCREYEAKNGVLPEMIINSDETIKLGLPEYIRLPKDCWVRVPVRIRKSLYEKYDGAKLYISYHFLNNIGVPVLNSPEIPICTGDIKLRLPIRTPNDLDGNCRLMIKAALKETSGANICQTEKTMSLQLI